jgi:hypothetical protein
MNRLYKFETINRITSEYYREEFWRLGTLKDVKKHYITVLDTPNLIPHLTYLDDNDEGTFVITLNLKGYMESNVIGHYKVRILIKKIEMLDKRISYKIRLIGPLKNGTNILTDEEAVNNDEI